MWKFSFSDGSGFGKNVITFGANMSSSVRVDNREKDILIPGKDTTQKLNDTALTAEKVFTKNFREQQKKLCLPLHYNGVSGYLFVNGAKIYKFKAKDSDINAASLLLGNASKYFSADNIKNGWICL